MRKLAFRSEWRLFGKADNIGLARAGAASNRLSGPTACQMTVLSAPLPCENVIRDGRKQCNTFPAANRMWHY
jgi:hypothetical protein